MVFTVGRVHRFVVTILHTHLYPVVLSLEHNIFMNFTSACPRAGMVCVIVCGLVAQRIVKSPCKLKVWARSVQSSLTQSDQRILDRR